MSGRRTGSLLVALVGLTLPLTACADVTTIVYAVASWLGSNYAYGTAIALIVGATVYGNAAARRKERAAAAARRAEYNAGLQDRTITVMRGDPPWQVVYGRCIVGGHYTDIFTTDLPYTDENGNPQTKADGLRHMVIELAAHECQAIHEVYIDGVAVGALDGNGWANGGEFFRSRHGTRTVTFTTSTSIPEAALAIVRAYSVLGSGMDESYVEQTVTISGGGLTLNGPAGIQVHCTYTVEDGGGTVRVSKNLGTASQAVDAYLNTVAPSRYTSNHRLRGRCYIAVSLDLTEPRFQGGSPNITADVSGRKVLDTRTSTTAWSDNPALCIRDFLVNAWGFAADAAEVSTAHCNAAANVCDQLISLTVGSTTENNQKRFTLNGAFTTDQGLESVLEAMAATMAGSVVYGGEWQINAGAWTAPVLTLTDDDLAGLVEVVQADTPTDELFNGLRGQIIQRGQQSPTDYNPYSNATFVTADGRELWSNLDLPFTDHLARARNLCRIFVERNRAGQTLRYPAKLPAWGLQVNDRVTLTHAELGISALTYRVTDWQWAVGDVVMLTLQRDAAGIWDLADAATADPTPNTDLPNPWAVSSITGAAATSGTATLLRTRDGTIVPRVQVTWNLVTDAQVQDGGAILVHWRRPNQTAWTLADTKDGRDTTAWIADVREGDPLSIRLTPRNRYGALGAPVYLGHTVVGKGQLPANVAGLTATQVPGGLLVKWTPNAETDYLDTEIRTGASWAGGTLVWRGTADRYLLPWPTAGSLTVRVKHRDTSLNESAADQTATVTVDGTILIGTPQIKDGAATEVFTNYAAGPTTATTSAASINVVTAAACKIIVTVSVNAECVNSSGSSKYRNAIVSVYAFGDIGGGGTAYDSRYISRNIANGETQRESYVSSYTFEGVSAGDDITFSGSVTGTTGATIDTDFTDIRLRVEVIYR